MEAAKRFSNSFADFGIVNQCFLIVSRIFANYLILSHLTAVLLNKKSRSLIGAWFWYGQPCVDYPPPTLPPLSAPFYCFPSSPLVYVYIV